ncbi:pantetheine-phosphate adenylyltransferase [Acaryochloris marina]|uniref:pantetheine-phosphate adenylyltransferase n=1 Tax=Acaryochloris marina TaxID=155978 RepID=UPI001BAEE756|nr:pantetheine-phosphate adenylyltransferase [Acaryochloris marina]QUY43402.1 pantetheine-phosphate adenylyltransferase [Acaryochloris marina S15]
MIAVYPGSFDPITLGHLDIIERGCNLFGSVIVAVARNPNKAPLFSVQQRLQQIQTCTQHLNNLELDTFDTLTVTYTQKRKAQVLLRGLRALSDFEYELQMAHTNHTLSPHIETVFLATSNEYSFLSSSLVKEIAKFGGSVAHLVPENVAIELEECFTKTPPSVSIPPPTAPITPPTD